VDRTVTFKQQEKSGHEPQPGLDTKTDRMTDRQSQWDFDFELTNQNENGERVSAVQLRVQLWSVNQRATETPLLILVTRKCLVKTRQRNSHCGELLKSKD
jgi:hypothetical protein